MGNNGLAFSLMGSSSTGHSLITVGHITFVKWPKHYITSHHGQRPPWCHVAKTHWFFDLTMCWLPSHTKLDLWRWMWWRIWQSNLDFRRWAPGLFLWPFFFKPLAISKGIARISYAICSLLSAFIIVFFLFNVFPCHHLFYNRKPKTFASFISLLLYFLDVHVSLTVWPVGVLQFKQLVRKG